MRFLMILVILGLTGCSSMEEDAAGMSCRELRYEERKLKDDIEDYEEEEMVTGIASIILDDDDLDSDAETAEVLGDISKDDLKIVRREQSRKGCYRKGKGKNR